MKLSECNVFSKTNLLKIFLIIVTIVLWMYFYVSSSVSLASLISFDLPSILTTFVTTNFLLFLLLFPLTTAVIIALSTYDNNLVNIIHILIGTVSGFLLSFILFGLSYKSLLFILFYIISHILLSIFSYNKFSENHKRIFSFASYTTSKISLLLTISVFLAILFYSLPHQHEFYNNMENGVVDMFIGDDISKWIGTSYDIGKISTKSNIDYLTSIKQYKDILDVDDVRVKNYVNFMNRFKESLNKDKETVEDDIKNSFPNLNNDSLKKKVKETINTIPMMIIIEHYFAFIFAFILASMCQLYFAIAFGLLGLFYVYLFYKLFYIKS